MKKSLIACAIILTCITAQAANWVHIGEGVDKSTIAVDTESITRDPNSRNLVTSWYRIIFANGSYNLIATQNDCARRTSRMLQMNGYSPDHHETGSFGPTLWSHIIPETMGEAHMKFVCKK
jgi:hypothetical protein